VCGSDVAILKPEQAMSPTDVNLLERVVEGSPVIVLLCLVAIGMLWRRMLRLDEKLIEMHAAQLIAAHEMRDAINSLTEALKQR
jgi:hypothetical protein